MESKPRNPLWLRVLDIVTSGVLAGVVSTVLCGGLSPLITLLLMSYLYFGKDQFGPQGALKGYGEVKDSLIASIAWPYLAWKKLNQDLQSPPSATYDAYVNDVFVGSMSSADYSKIQRQVLRDPRLYFAQAFNLVRVITKVLDTFVMGIPVLAFWGLFALAYFAPENYESILSSLQQGPDAIRALANGYMGILLEVGFFFLLFTTVIRGHVPGFSNVFAVATNRLLRRHLRVAAEGDVALHLQVVLPVARAQYQ